MEPKENISYQDLMRFQKKFKKLVGDLNKLLSEVDEASGCEGSASFYYADDTLTLMCGDPFESGGCARQDRILAEASLKGAGGSW